MGKLIRLSDIHYARAKERIHKQLQWELYEGVLGNALARAVDLELTKAFAIDRLDDAGIDPVTAQRVRETY